MMAWNLIKNYLDQIVKSKILFSDSSYHDNMKNHINNLQL